MTWTSMVNVEKNRGKIASAKEYLVCRTGKKKKSLIGYEGWGKGEVMARTMVFLASCWWYSSRIFSTVEGQQAAGGR